MIRLMITTPSLTIAPGATPDTLWTYTVAATGEAFSFGPPVFEVDGQIVTAQAEALRPDSPARTLPSGVTEHVYRGAVTGNPGLSLTVTWQVAPDSPVVRFRYGLSGEGPTPPAPLPRGEGGDREEPVGAGLVPAPFPSSPFPSSPFPPGEGWARNEPGVGPTAVGSSRAPRHLTKTGGRDALTYLSTSFAGLPSVTEVRLAEFNERVHSFCLAERDVEQSQFAEGLTAIGPILVGSSDTHALVMAYEHGSQIPDAFLQFRLAPDRTVCLYAVKGNYYDGQPADGYETVWLHAGAVAGTQDDLARTYRDFLLRYVTQNAASRKPYIFYNTWNFQERNRWWYGHPYLESMRQDRMEAEIEAAHRMGIDVFVLDTGWYEKTGDWQVNRERFPDGLASIRKTLEAYGMKLGLWFNPTVAALSSRMRRAHKDCLMTSGGRPHEPHEVWETEESQGLCLVSRYGEAFADELIRLHREVGVTYFKWDAIGQYGCDSPDHFHGTAANSERERAESYAFQQAAYMARVVNRLCAACPDAIVDFDITEGGRSVGLGFLSAGKYFLLNNGPYSHNYDMAVPADGNVNLFFFPGPARAWVCRTPLTYDKWVPSVLFLTHYLPDDPQANQELNLASLVLGQNGIWGDLLRLSEEGIARFADAVGA